MWDVEWLLVGHVVSRLGGSGAGGMGLSRILLPLGGVLLLTKALAVVTLEGKELLEVGLAVVLARESGIAAESEDLLAVLALHASLVEDDVVGSHALHGVDGLSADLARLLLDAHRGGGRSRVGAASNLGALDGRVRDLEGTHALSKGRGTDALLLSRDLRGTGGNGGLDLFLLLSNDSSLLDDSLFLSLSLSLDLGRLLSLNLGGLLGLGHDG
mmetsp:Transcript_31088/g.50298  ORF Transcript_31088/g.50298 Transcript_31088/m.50298 type:complete len:214 (-) Transcript_31088:112-753(-)